MSGRVFSLNKWKHTITFALTDLKSTVLFFSLIVFHNNFINVHFF